MNDRQAFDGVSVPTRRSRGAASRFVPLAAALGLAIAALPSARAAEPGTMTEVLNFGMNIYTHKYAQDGKPAKDTTVQNGAALSEFPGWGIFLTDHFRVGLNLQLTEAVTDIPKNGNFTTFGFLPQFNYNFWGPFTASLVPSFYSRIASKDQFGFALQEVLSASFPVVGKLSVGGAIEIPEYFTPYRSIGVTPLLGVAYKL